MKCIGVEIKTLGNTLGANCLIIHELRVRATTEKLSKKGRLTSKAWIYWRCEQPNLSNGFNRQPVGVYQEINPSGKTWWTTTEFGDAADRECPVVCGRWGHPMADAAERLPALEKRLSLGLLQRLWAERKPYVRTGQARPLTHLFAGRITHCVPQSLRKTHIRATIDIRQVAPGIGTFVHPPEWHPALGRVFDLGGFTGAKDIIPAQAIQTGSKGLTGMNAIRQQGHGHPVRNAIIDRVEQRAGVLCPGRIWVVDAHPERQAHAIGGPANLDDVVIGAVAGFVDGQIQVGGGHAGQDRADKGIIQILHGQAQIPQDAAHLGRIAVGVGAKGSTC